MCEQKLRMANRVAFQERLYPEMQRPFRVLLSRINAVMVPWLLRGKYMGMIMTPLWVSCFLRSSSSFLFSRGRGGSAAGAI